MIKNYNFNIAEEEKRQILSLHESRTKRHYLINEQSDVYNPTIEQAKLFVDKVNAYKAKNPNGAALQDAKLMNSYQIALNKISENPAKPVQSQTQTNNNSFTFSKYVKQAQTALGVTADGKFGPKTLEALMAKLTPTNVTTPPVDKAAADKLEKENAFKASIEKTIADNKALKEKGMAFPWSKESVATQSPADKAAADKAVADKAAADKLALEKTIANKSGIVIPPQEVKQPPLGSGGFKGMPKPTKF